MDILIIINSRHKLDRTVALLLGKINQNESFQVITQYTEFKRHPEEIIAKFSQKIEVILVVGGDGTFHEVANAYFKNNCQASIGFIPNGTGNDLIRMFRPIDADRFIERIKARVTNKMDVGFLQGETEERYFLNIAGIGLDGKVIAIMEESDTDKETRLSYAKAILKAFFTFKKPVLSIKGDDFSYSGSMMMVAMCNGRVFGNGLTISPSASITDGVIHITLLGKVSLMDYILNLGKLKKGRSIQHKEVHYHETKSLEVKCISGEVYGEADGEYLEMKSLRMKIIPASLPVINEMEE